MGDTCKYSVTRARTQDTTKVKVSSLPVSFPCVNCLLKGWEEVPKSRCSCELFIINYVNHKLKVWVHHLDIRACRLMVSLLSLRFILTLPPPSLPFVIVLQWQEWQSAYLATVLVYFSCDVLTHFGGSACTLGCGTEGLKQQSCWDHIWLKGVVPAIKLMVSCLQEPTLNQAPGRTFYRCFTSSILLLFDFDVVPGATTNLMLKCCYW